MRVHIVTAHPERKSFNFKLAAVAERHFAASGNAVTSSDLYGMGFDPREGPDKFGRRRDPARFYAQDEQRFSHSHGALDASVASELDKLMQSDLLIVHFPLWWFGMPAILKGWIDRVFVYGGMYSSKRRFETGVCQGKKVLLSVTTGSSASDCSPRGREGDTRLILWPALYSFHYVGFDVFEPFLVFGVKGRIDIEHVAAENQSLQCYETFLDGIERAPLMKFNGAEDWDAAGRLKIGAPSYSPFITNEL